MSRLLDAVEWTARKSAVFAEGDTPFSAHVTKGNRSRVVVVAGDNATGKSLFVRVVALHLGSTGGQKTPVHNVTISIRERSGAGADGFGGLRRAMMFGDEETSSTGAISVNTLSRSFPNMDERRGVLVLDEPEIGLSHGYAAAMGTYIARQAMGLPMNCAGVMVVTHSKALVKALREELGGNPVWVHLGGRRSMDQWLADDDQKSVEDLLALPEIGHERFRTVQSIVNDAKKRK